jgi:Tfp pilus assembly protein PilF
MKGCRFLPCTAIAFFLISNLLGCGPSREQLREEADSSRKLGEAYLNAGNPTAALKELLKAEEKDPDNHILQNDLGLAYMGKDRVELAIPHFKKAIALKPDFSPGKNNLGYAYLRNKQYDKAIDVFQDVSQDLLYATPQRPLAGLGAAYYHKGQFDLARTSYLKALKINPRYPSALWGLGRTQIAMGDITEAIQSLEKAVAHAPNFTDAWFDLGGAYRRTGEDEKAVAAYEKVVSLSPGSPLAESATEEIQALKP